MALIDVGKIVGLTNNIGSTLTTVNKVNPVNLSGILSKISFHVAVALVVGLKIGSFFVVGGDNLTCRAFQLLGDFGVGTHNDIACALAMEAGDYIGVYMLTGTPRGVNVGEPGVWYKAGDQTACVNEPFNWLANYAVYLYGEGATVEAVRVQSGSIGGLLIF